MPRTSDGSLARNFSPLPPSRFSIKGTKSAAAYLDLSKSEIRLGALLSVLSEGNETSYVRFRTIWVYSRDATQRASSQQPGFYRMTITLRRPAGGEAVADQPHEDLSTGSTLSDPCACEWTKLPNKILVEFGAHILQYLICSLAG
jgi:hypothetical protein